ncbi:hypothetical protein DV113_004800 [Geotrichum candidum]|uniref:Similar to saccharomyces cerevisiae YBR273C UBX7 UBX (Ubiquitin regulatory X) domain-containing protein that interacts with Cdc48p n=1 Tax=Geotrichum candidum TaxID=1173061 RepID=A0A0J9X9P3_GEOCN|nr:hypothetical protein DV454_004202 [Geotrichum candidum]KAF7497164.1 hypothetical protein DV113_004800 [Geotrichum candidum]KAI8131436.1 hypothetical protein DUD61_004912 [Geotrichum candidum]CDO53891.1 similar to saccharomyces cerevisiae YBR273C UBX7 UBX (ubiquitin regulatory X) domain-containing protein that interacts with Cdc48p [Geotrichum candidum]
MTLTFYAAINDAIARSIQTSRVLLILLTTSDDAATSDTPQWPHTLAALADGTISDANTVGLRMERGSPDYDLFVQIFPINTASNNTAPCLVFIHQGAVRLIFREGDDEAQLATVYRSLEAPAAATATPEMTGSSAAHSPAPIASPAPASTPAVVAPEPAGQNPEIASTRLTQTTPPLEPATAAATPQKTPAKQNTTGTSPVRPASSPDAAAPASPRPAAASPTTAAPGPAKKPNRKLSHGNPQQQQERARVLRLLESDRLERDAQRKLEREARLSMSQEKRPVLEEDESAVESDTPVVTPKLDADSCALLIRLFDGTPVKHIFAATDTLLDVRAYLDNARPDMAAAPYAFFLPLAKKTFGDGEEAQALRALELAPSATLVLKPATSSVYSAYASERGSPASHIGRAISALSNAVYVFLGIGYTPPTLESQLPSADPGLIRQAFEQRVSSSSSGTTGNNSASNATERSGEELRQIYISSSASSSSAAINKTFQVIQTSDEAKETATYNGNHLSLQDDDKKNDQSSSK